MPTTTVDTKAQKIQDQNVKADLEARKQGAEMEDAGARPMPGRAGVPPSPSGKAETRLFQVSPGKKVWLTQKDAEARGFFWRPEPD
jgi:hypothetical protein